VKELRQELSKRVTPRQILLRDKLCFVAGSVGAMCAAAVPTSNALIESWVFCVI
jgi:hypothetical protein